MSKALAELLSIMARLRAPGGCPWDREQTSATVAPYTIEEAYEVAAAIESGDLQQLRDELGDLLLQVVFHAQIASEAGHFDFDSVAATISNKLVRRHPHVFAADGAVPRSSEEQFKEWESIKAEERRAAPALASSHLEGVPQALPALMRAGKLSRRAARVGFLDNGHGSVVRFFYRLLAVVGQRFVIQTKSAIETGFAFVAAIAA